jgi:hypothetical protein
MLRTTVDFLLPQNRTTNSKVCEKGQSTIEFIVSFSIVFGLLMMFVRVALNSTAGYMVHYATFMASRTYLVHDNNSNTPAGADNGAKTQAEQVFNLYNSHPGSLTIMAPGDAGVSYLVGTVFSFEQKFSSSPMLGGNHSIDLISESFLGREPSRSECHQRVCDVFTMQHNSGCDINVTLYDNGC